MATLSVQSTSLSGLDPTFASAASGGDDFPNTGDEYVEVDNGSGSPITVTVTGSEQCSQGFTHDAQVSVPAGESRRIGPFPTARFGDSVDISYSATASVTVAVVEN